MINRQTLIQQLSWRYAVKVFDSSKKISDEDWAALEQALVLTPSSFGLQPWKFIVVTHQGLREELKKVSWNQSQVTEASHLVVFASKIKVTKEDIQKLIETTARVRALPIEKLQGYQHMMQAHLIEGPVKDKQEQWAAHQVYIALGHLMACAAVMGIDACPMEGLEPLAYDRILKLENTGYHTVVACALGYRSEKDIYAGLPKVRYTPKELIMRLD